MPTLSIFAISHYCEKARWALDYTGINYQLAHLAPGPHGQWAKDKGLKESSLPVLDTDERYLQGSSAIIDWADQHATNGKALTPEDSEPALAIELRCDNVIGVHIRRMFYSEALVEHPETVLPVFIKDLTEEQQATTTEIWPVIRNVMIENMDLGKAQGEESRQLLEVELDWLDSLYADGRRFLCGDEFSRADLTASSLLARTAEAREYPSANTMPLPPTMATIVAGWRTRPSLERIRENYRQYR